MIPKDPKFTTPGFPSLPSPPPFTAQASLLCPSGVLVAKEDLQRLQAEIANSIDRSRADGCYYRTAGGIEFIRISAERAMTFGLTIIDEEAILQ
ncbi:MAG: hypothetical protein AB4290_26345 [Spirulina sp.]